MGHLRWFKLMIGIVLLVSVVGPASHNVQAQGQPTPLRVEEAVTGELTAAAPTAVYSIDVYDSLRMAVVFDVTEGDMQVSVVVLDQDKTTLLAGSTGPHANGLIVEFPATGTYYIGVQGDSGTSAKFRLFVNASPVLPINEFVVASYPVAGTSTQCTDNTPVAGFTTTEDLNVCFVMALITDPVKIDVEWWSPSGTVSGQESVTADSSYNGELLLTGLVYKDTAWDSGWWTVHFLINGELAHIQWVWVE